MNQCCGALLDVSNNKRLNCCARIGHNDHKRGGSAASRSPQGNRPALVRGGLPNTGRVPKPYVSGSGFSINADYGLAPRLVVVPTCEPLLYETAEKCVRASGFIAALRLNAFGFRDAADGETHQQDESTHSNHCHPRRTSRVESYNGHHLIARCSVSFVWPATRSPAGEGWRPRRDLNSRPCP